MNTYSHRYLNKTGLYWRIAASCLAAWLSVHSSVAAPYLPSSADEVLERLPTFANNGDQALRPLQRALNNDPENLQLATATARRLIEKARADADPRYYGYAEAAIGHWWRQPQPPTAVLMLRAAIRQHRHDFNGALADVRDVLAEAPRNAQAWLTQAVILGVRGDYQPAMTSCLVLKRLSSRLIAATCAAHIAALNGKAQAAYPYLKDAASGAADEQEQLWAYTVLAEIAARLGDNKAAEAHFLQALALGQRDVYLLSAYADFLLDQNRPTDVVALLQDDTRADGLLLRLALAEQALNLAAASQHRNELEARMAAYRLRGDTIHQREEARIDLQLLKQPKEALRLALLNWKLQREPWDARLVLEAALTAGEPSAAKPVLAWLAESKTEDKTLQRLIAQLN